MIKRESVFILGAGASRPFGYPTGRQLREKILEDLKDPESLNLAKDSNEYLERVVRFQRFEEMGFKKKDVLSFRDAFNRSIRYSIDAFLEDRDEFIPLGKRAIADILIPCEDEEVLFNTDDAKIRNWFAYLINKLKSNISNFLENKISFITFNYDRSLEHFLYNHFVNAFKTTQEEVIKLISKIPIIHVYGKMNDLDWQSPEGRAYSVKYNSQELSKAAEKISIVSEKNLDIESSPDFKHAHQLLEKARNVYFLGFGYDENNLNRLKLNQPGNASFWQNKSNIVGTNHQLDFLARSAVNRYFSGKMFQFGPVNSDILDFLKQYLIVD